MNFDVNGKQMTKNLMEQIRVMQETSVDMQDKNKYMLKIPENSKY